MPHAAPLTFRGEVWRIPLVLAFVGFDPGRRLLETSLGAEARAVAEAAVAAMQKPAGAQGAEMFWLVSHVAFAVLNAVFDLNQADRAALLTGDGARFLAAVTDVAIDGGLRATVAALPASAGTIFRDPAFFARVQAKWRALGAGIVE